MNKRIVNPGDRFNHLTILEEVESAISPKGSVTRQFRCQCDCGNVVTIRLCNLVTGQTTRCSKTCSDKVRYKSRLYRVWIDMKKRCYNPACNKYYLYGGRGITVCDAWLHNYYAFEQWALANGYKEDIRDTGRNNLTLDRIDCDGNYCPENCRWTTWSVQNKNKRKKIS